MIKLIKCINYARTVLFTLLFSPPLLLLLLRLLVLREVFSELFSFLSELFFFSELFSLEEWRWCVWKVKR